MADSISAVRKLKQLLGGITTAGKYVTQKMTADTVFINQPDYSGTNGVAVVGVRVSASDTLEVDFYNIDPLSSLTPASGTYRIMAMRT